MFRELVHVDGEKAYDNSNTVNSKFHLIQTFFKILATFLSLQC